jgi:hypothetical protein
MSKSDSEINTPLRMKKEDDKSHAYTGQGFSSSSSSTNHPKEKEVKGEKEVKEQATPTPKTPTSQAQPNPLPSLPSTEYTSDEDSDTNSVTSIGSYSSSEKERRRRKIKRVRQNDFSYKDFVDYRASQRDPTKSVGTPLPIYRDANGNVFQAIDHSGVVPNFMSDTLYREKPRPVDPKRIEAIKKTIPVCKRDNFQKFKEALEEVADAYDWPSYILDLKAKAFNAAKAKKRERPTDRAIRKEAYTVIWQKIHSDLKDHVRDDEKRGDAQNLYRRLRKVICRNSKEYALELEAKLSSIFKEGCANRNIIEYGVAIKNANDQLKAVDQGFSEEKLVLLYKKGLPMRLSVVTIKLSKKKYGTLRKARALIEEYVRDTEQDTMTFPKEFKYLPEEERKSRKDRGTKKESQKEELKHSKDKKKLSSNISSIVCQYYKQGKCNKGKTCSLILTRLRR